MTTSSEISENAIELLWIEVEDLRIMFLSFYSSVSNEFTNLLFVHIVVLLVLIRYDIRAPGVCYSI